MKMVGKKLIYIVMFISFPAFIMQLMLIHGSYNKSNPNLLSAVSEECAKQFQDPVILKKLSRMVAKGDPDGFMNIIKKLMPSCQLQITEYVSQYGYGLIDPVLSSADQSWSNFSSYNFTNTTRVKLSRNNSTPLLSLCPRQSPLLKGKIQVELLGK